MGHTQGFHQEEWGLSNDKHFFSRSMVTLRPQNDLVRLREQNYLVGLGKKNKLKKYHGLG